MELGSFSARQRAQILSAKRRGAWLAADRRRVRQYRIARQYLQDRIAWEWLLHRLRFDLGAAFDAATGGTAVQLTNSATTNHTTGTATSTIVCAHVGWWSTTAVTLVGVTHNGNAMAVIKNNLDTTWPNRWGAAIFVIAVGTGDGASHPVIATFSGNVEDGDLMVVSWSGIDQATIFRVAPTPTSVDTTSGSISLTVANAQSGDIVIDTGIISTPSGLTSGQTRRAGIDNMNANGNSLQTSSAAAVGSTNMSYTFDGAERFGILAGAALIPASGGTLMGQVWL